RPLAETLDEREAALRDQGGRHRAAELALAEIKKTRQTVEGGLCPFLVEPCQNVAAKGEGLTLESYFDHQIDLAGHGLQLSLATLEQSRKRVEEAGAARRQLQSEPTLRAELARIAQLRQAGEAERDRQAALERELADAPERLCEADARVAALQEQ